MYWAAAHTTLISFNRVKIMLNSSSATACFPIICAHITVWIKFCSSHKIHYTRYCKRILSDLQYYAIIEKKESKKWAIECALKWALELKYRLKAKLSDKATIFSRDCQLSTIITLKLHLWLLFHRKSWLFRLQWP